MSNEEQKDFWTLPRIALIVAILGGLTTLYIQWDNIIRLWRERTRPEFTITSPTNQETVTQSCQVTGQLHGKGKKVVIWVHSVKTQGYSRQDDTGAIDKNGSWRNSITVGDANFDHAEQWVIMAFAVDPTAINFTSPTNPPTGALQASVTVKRKN